MTTTPTPTADDRSRITPVTTDPVELVDLAIDAAAAAVEDLRHAAGRDYYAAEQFEIARDIARDIIAGMLAHGSTHASVLLSARMSSVDEARAMRGGR